MGYPNLYDYTVKALKLPEGSTYAFINVSRKSVEVPKIKEAIENGEITVSQAKRVLGVIRPETHNLWIEKAKELSQVLSQKIRKACTLEEAIEAMADNFLKDHDPLEKAKRLALKESPKRVALQSQSQILLCKGHHQLTHDRIYP
jgi:hypothetical protein